MVSNSKCVAGLGRRIFNKKEILKEIETEEVEEEDIMKDVPDYERSTNKKTEIQHFTTLFNTLVINENSSSKSKEGFILLDITYCSFVHSSYTYIFRFPLGSI